MVDWDQYKLTHTGFVPKPADSVDGLISRLLALDVEALEREAEVLARKYNTVEALLDLARHRDPLKKHAGCSSRRAD